MRRSAPPRRDALHRRRCLLKVDFTHTGAPSCGERTTLLTAAGEKETSRSQASSTTARPSS
eukprot:COSAG02_NODE_425_length_22574_cov_29.550300_12_plen_60_part_01